MKQPVEPTPIDVPNASPEERHRQLLRRFMVLQEDERRQVARELHEGAGQMLTSLLFGIKMLEGAMTLVEVNRFLPELKSQVWETLETLRQISVNLRPSTRAYISGCFPASSEEGRRFMRLWLMLSKCSPGRPLSIRFLLAHAGSSPLYILSSKPGSKVSSIFGSLKPSIFGTSANSGPGMNHRASRNLWR